MTFPIYLVLIMLFVRLAIWAIDELLTIFYE